LGNTQFRSPGSKGCTGAGHADINLVVVHRDSVSAYPTVDRATADSGSKSLLTCPVLTERTAQRSTASLSKVAMLLLDRYSFVIVGLDAQWEERL
jgi:hypothetical protein